MNIEALCASVAGADAVVPAGARTHWEVGAPVTSTAAVEVAAPAGVVRYEPEDLTVTVGAGTAFRELDATLARAGQVCALDPRDPAATVGGILACGLSGVRRLRHGPLREHVLEVRFVTAQGRLVKAGGPTVKNVTGYDLPRLLVGSFGTLGVLAQVTLRCRPRPAATAWFACDDRRNLGSLFRAGALLWDGESTRVLLEGSARDLEAQARALAPASAPALPEGAHRGRISVAPGTLDAVGTALHDVGEGEIRWLAELGVGTVHVAGDAPDALSRAREIAAAHGGWLLREAGGNGIDGFGRPLPNLALMRRIKAAFDPADKCNPGRLPL